MDLAKLETCVGFIWCNSSTDRQIPWLSSVQNGQVTDLDRWSFIFNGSQTFLHQSCGFQLMAVSDRTLSFSFDFYKPSGDNFNNLHLFTSNVVRYCI
jgi:hypothetical protein